MGQDILALILSTNRDWIVYIYIARGALAMSPDRLFLRVSFCTCHRLYCRYDLFSVIRGKSLIAAAVIAVAAVAAADAAAVVVIIAVLVLLLLLLQPLEDIPPSLLHQGDNMDDSNMELGEVGVPALRRRLARLEKTVSRFQDENDKLWEAVNGLQAPRKVGSLSGRLEGMRAWNLSAAAAATSGSSVNERVPPTASTTSSSAAATTAFFSTHERAPHHNADE
ncbi:unnamed protein product [Fusarium graminearum]|uniref:Uncharacterized protein n=1 Tax=Gibberella zeae TaxID=5518 RepID=A0A4U9F632_GIBZA|nr:unnamed protein product [Fusarium graminearum]VTO91670.1 unnamed protein product [Fusarium graminearum]